MKNFNLYKLVMLLMVTVAIVSCVQDDDFETPNTIVVAPNLEGDVLTIMGINSAFEQLVADAADDLGVDPSDFNYEDVLAEVSTARITERGATRADDNFSESAMEDRKREGYF